MCPQPAPSNEDEIDVTLEAIAGRAMAKADGAPVEETFRIQVIEGPDNTGPRGATGLGGAAPARIVIGTSPAADLRLTDRQVSRRHVAITLEPGALVASDLGSKNGTWLGGLRIREVELRGGERLRVGETTLLVERGPAEPAALGSDVRFGRVLGASREMRRLYPLLERLAQTTIPVVLQGEAGTGKELVAEAIHAEGPRSSGPFVIVDCSALPGPELERALFGSADAPGALAEARGGTLLIDEIAELGPTAQSKLKKALDLQSSAQLDVRFLVSTRRDLDREVQSGRFRDDLFHRLTVGRVELPPLRKRAADIALLAEHFAAELGGSLAAVNASVVAAWQEAPWPSNVRELRSQVAKQVALGELAALSYAPPPAALAAPAPTEADWLEPILDEKLPLVEARERVIAVFERRYLERMLRESGGNVVRAAARAGIARRYFQILKAKRIP